MELKKETRNIFLGILLIAATWGAHFLLMDKFYTVESGKQYLEKEGYTMVEGGETILRVREGCTFRRWRDSEVTARTYTVTDADGQRVKKTVCFGWGPYMSGKTY